MKPVLLPYSCFACRKWTATRISFAAIFAIYECTACGNVLKKQTTPRKLASELRDYKAFLAFAIYQHPGFSDLYVEGRSHTPEDLGSPLLGRQQDASSNT